MSLTGRRLRRMLAAAAVAAVAAAWVAVAVPVAVVIGRAIRHADRAAYTPQIDAPLWHDTDMPGPDRPPAALAGAVLGLAYAPDETAARYWLTMCARRGADWKLQRDLWDLWQRQHAAGIQRLPTTDPRTATTEENRP